MSTSSADSSYHPSITDFLDDDLSANGSIDLGEIFSPDNPNNSPFNIQDFEIAF
jgi:hypothetical protein